MVHRATSCEDWPTFALRPCARGGEPRIGMSIEMRTGMCIDTCAFSAPTPVPVSTPISAAFLSLHLSPYTGPPTPAAVGGACDDATTMCKDWARRGECAGRNAPYMAAERVFFLDISEHADGERRGPASI